MRIAIDARGAQEERGGRGVMVRELLLALARRDDDHEYALLGRERWDAPLDGRFRWVTLPEADPLWNVRAGLTAHRHGDVFLSSNSYLTAWFTQVPTAAIVCDLVAFDPALMPKRRSRVIELVTLPRCVRRAGSLPCISRATADDLVARFPRAVGKAPVTLLAADERFAAATDADVERVRAAHDLHRPYVLAVGTLEPRKNLPRLIEAFAALPADVRDAHELVLVGALGWDTAETEGAVSRHRDLVRQTGHVPDADLPGLYRGAELFAFPSLYEGFGLPILEAMAAGTATVTSDVSSMPEVAGDAALYCSPRDVASITGALERGLRDPALRDRLAARGRERAAAFSWDRYAAETLAVVEDLGRR